jgi:hypothetical protein
MAFEHYDSGRTKLFAQAHFTGSFVRDNAVNARVSPDEYPTPYNVVYLSSDSLFVFGGAYGDRGGTGSFVARVDPQTLQTVWFNQLINTVETDEWNYPGVLSALQDGLLYLAFTQDPCSCCAGHEHGNCVYPGFHPAGDLLKHLGRP